MNRFISSVVNFFKGTVNENDVEEQRKMLEISDSQLKMEAEVEASVDRAIIAFTIDLVKQKEKLKSITQLRDSIITDLELSEKVVATKADDDPEKAIQIEKINKAKKLVYEELPITIDKLEEKVEEYEGKIYNLKERKLTLATLRKSTDENKKIIEQSYKESQDQLEKQNKAENSGKEQSQIQLEDIPEEHNDGHEEEDLEGGLMQALNHSNNGDSTSQIHDDLHDNHEQQVAVHFVSPDDENGNENELLNLNVDPQEIVIPSSSTTQAVQTSTQALDDELDMLTIRAQGTDIQPFQPRVFNDLNVEKSP